MNKSENLKKNFKEILKKQKKIRSKEKVEKK